MFITNETQQCEGKCTAVENFVEFAGLAGGSAKIADMARFGDHKLNAEARRRREERVFV
jgi:hypothetical protein